MINFTHRRGAIGILLILADSGFQIAFMVLIWTKIVFQEASLIKSTELPRQSLFMSDMHYATFNFYVGVYILITIVPQVISGLLFQMKNISGCAYFMVKMVMIMLGVLNLHLPCLIFSPLGNSFKPVIGKGPQRQWIFGRNVAQIFMSIPMITNLMLVEYTNNKIVKLTIFFAFF